jgi:Fur family ferric uptake transcriptional regulator
MAPTTADLPHFQSPESVLNALRGQGLRVSTARRLVVHTLFEAERPLSAEQIATGLNGSPASLDLASVYRNLETLKGLGVVQHLRVGDGPNRWTLARGRQREYLACDRCGTLKEVGPGELDTARGEIHRRFGFQARFSQVPMVGTCRDCAAG